MFTTPKEYIDHYVTVLKEEYKFNDLKVNYHGLVGFLMNLFAWTNYDIKQYYDYLFKEGFLATAEETKNLYLHASTYGYVVGFATPATVTGTFTFDFSMIPSRITDVYKREIIFSSPLEITIGGYIFQTNHEYRFFEEGPDDNIQYYSKINSSTDRQRLVSSASPQITVPIYDLKQFEITTYDKSITNYDYGTYFSYNVAIDEDSHLSDLKINIKSVDSSVYEEYELSRVKSFDTSLSKSVYLDQKSDKLYILELGNGYHGVWLPNSMMQVDVYTTKGAIVNSLVRQTGSSSGNFSIINYNDELEILSEKSTTITANNFVIDCQSVSGGADILTDVDLKNDIHSWVESRDNLINRSDFFNVFSSYLKDFDVIFKKHQFIDNNFYLCRTLRDQYKNIYYTTNHTYKCIRYDDTSLISNLTATVLDDYTDSTLTPSRYYYKIIAVDKFYRSIPSTAITPTILSTGDAVSLTWDVVDEADSYRVYGRTNKYTQYWAVDKDHVDIDGQVYFIDIGADGTTDNCGTVYEVIDQINFPVFTKDLSETFDLTESIYTWTLSDSDNDSYTYVISGKTFWYTPETIYRDGVALTKITTLSTSQLVDDSWFLLNEKIYIKLEAPFDVNTVVITAKYNKDVTLNSPFVYKYNEFFDWFEGYFMYDNIVQYPIISNAISTNTLISHLNIIYDTVNNITTIYIKSYQDIDNDTYSFTMKIDGVDIDYVDVTYDEDNDTFYREVDGFFDSDIKILFKCYLTSVLQFEGTTAIFRQTYAVKDQLVLVKYISEEEDYYICNIPVLDFVRPTASSNEYENLDYVYSQIFSFIADSNLRENRIMSDSVQTRFLNTTYCDSYYSNKLLVQAYDHNIILPLNINIAIKYNTSDIDFTETYSDIELLVAEYLQTYATGIDIKFYPSQITDLIHDYNSNIISVVINIFDNYGTLLNNGIEIKSQDSLLPSIDSKLKMVEFTSVYWWWNLNNINITQTA